MKQAYSVVAICAAFLATTGAFAQTKGPEGQWYCEWGYQTTAPGKPPNAVGGQFNIAIQPGGRAQGNGYDSATASQMQFQAQWSFQGRQLTVQGQQFFANGWPSQPGNFNLISNMTSDTTMALTQKYPKGVYASQCRRTE